MRKAIMRVAACCLAGCVTAGGYAITANAATLSSALPAAGSAVAMKEGNSIDTIKSSGRPGIQVTKEKKTAQKTVQDKDKEETKSTEKNSKSTITGDALLSAGAGAVITPRQEKQPAAENEKARQSQEQQKSESTDADSAKASSEKDAGKEQPAQAQTEEPAEEQATQGTGQETPAEEPAAEEQAPQEEETSLAIAQVNDYVNVRDKAGEDGEVVGKLYNKSAGEVISKEGDWYKITSGDVVGYVKSEYVVTGDAAVELARQVGNRVAVVNTTTLYVRESADKESPVIGMVPNGDVLTVSEETDGWVKVDIEEGSGYVSTDYVNVSTEFVKAESKVAEEARLAREAEEREAARKAAEKAEEERREEQRRQEEEREQEAVSDNTVSENKTEEAKKEKKEDTKAMEAPSVSGNGAGSSVASFATQFVGNPYVYGGTSLTNGADCSGFVMSVYKNFGISLPHSSGALRSVGYDAGGLGNAQPGDIVCYSGHVGVYIGNGQIVHASTAATGIKISNAAYKPVLSVRRIF